MFDAELFGDEMAAMVRDVVSRATSPLIAANAALAAENKALSERLTALESRAPGLTEDRATAMLEERLASLPAPEPGKPGADCDMDAVKAMVAGAVAEAVAGLPPAKDGEPGVVDMAEVERLVAERVEAAIEALPAPEKGDPGVVDMEAIAELIEQAVAALPAPRDGKDADMGIIELAIAERVERAVAAIPAAKDGVGMAGVFKDHEGNLIFTLTNGDTRNLGRIDGKDGETFTLDDFDIVPVDERTIRMGFTKGEIKHTFELAFPIPLDAGVWAPTKQYERGDGVTWAGSYWIAQRDAPGKPDTADSGWRLSVKRGRDGKDADTKALLIEAGNVARAEIARSTKSAAK